MSSQKEFWPTKVHLLIDCPNLLHRAYHTTGGRLDMGTTFGFLKYVEWLHREFATNNLVFCFDSRTSLRKAAYPNYRAAREAKKQEWTAEEADKYASFYSEVQDLRIAVLPDLGYNNVFCQRGYEADDLIASLVKDDCWGGWDQFVIVSSDKDLYQLLGSRVRMWLPTTKKTFTEASLSNGYFQISPTQWPYVKAIAGCATDGIAGVTGVGDITAAKYLRGLLPENSKKAKLIESSHAVWQRNLPLVKLPYKGAQKMKLRSDTIGIKKWNRVVRELGMESLVRLT